jgi:hypothetical protein
LAIETTSSPPCGNRRRGVGGRVGRVGQARVSMAFSSSVVMARDLAWLAGV